MLRNKPWLLATFIFVVCFIVVNPQGEFPINDDWLFFRQVEAFSMGEYRINTLIEPSFIFQGVVGMLWVRFFGLSFLSLRILTLLVSLGFLSGVYAILRKFGADKKFTLVSLLILAFNPIILSSTLSFMTEMYLLAPLVWSVYFLLRYFSDTSYKSLVLGLVFAAGAFLVRQTGVVIFISLLLVQVLYFVRTRKKEYVFGTGLTLITLFITLLVWQKWPRYSFDGDSSFNPFKYFIEPKFVKQRLSEFVFIFPPIAFFLAPLTMSLSKKPGYSRLPFVTPAKLAYLGLILWISRLLFNFDIFPMGSVFYVEGLHAKSGFKTNLSIFDNILFKIFLAVFVATAILSLFLVLYRVISKTKKSPEYFFLLFTALGFLGILVLSKDFYDRYTLPVLVILVFMIGYYVAREDVSIVIRRSYLGLFLLLAFSLFLNLEFMTAQRLKWDQAMLLQERTGLNTQIAVDGTYTKYSRAKEKSDYTGSIGTMPPGLEYLCYVQSYTFKGSNAVFKVFSNLDNTLDKKLDNPKIYDRKESEEKRIKKHLDELIYNREYFSPIYSIIGKKAYVGSWCEPGVVLE